MIETIVIVCVVGIVAGLVGALIALRMERNTVRNIQAEHEAWEQAQENYRYSWERKQAKRLAEIEARLNATTSAIRREWEAWKEKDQERTQSLARQYEVFEQRSRLEQELARLPHVEEMPVGDDASLVRPQWHPAMLRGVDLSGRDLSHRYLRGADLREARLVGTNLFMADLSGALLSHANLSGADLTGANLVGADLRDAILTDANLQVADVQNALLAGSNLIGARHLTNKQLALAHFDETTKLDDDTDLTEPQLPAIRRTIPLQDVDVAVPAPAAPLAPANETQERDHTPPQQHVPDSPPLDESAAGQIIEEQEGEAPHDEDEPAGERFVEEQESVMIAEEQEDAELEQPQALPATPPDDERPSTEQEAETVDDEQTFVMIEQPQALPDTPLPEEPAGETPVYEEENETTDEGDGDDEADEQEMAEASETSFATLLPDLDSLLESSADSHFFSPLAPNDSLLDLNVTDSLVEQQDDAQASEADTTTTVKAHPRRGKTKRARTGRRR